MARRETSSVGALARGRCSSAWRYSFQNECTGHTESTATALSAHSGVPAESVEGPRALAGADCDGGGLTDGSCGEDVEDVAGEEDDGDEGLKSRRS